MTWNLPCRYARSLGKQLWKVNAELHDNCLFYKNKVDGSQRLAISSQTKKECVFKVCLHMIAVVELIYE